MFANGWASEKWRIAVLLVLATVVGFLSDQWALSFLAFVAFYAAWHLMQLRKVEHWLSIKGTESSAPIAFGLWNELINHIFRLHKRHDRIRQRQNDLIQRFQETAAATPDATIILGPYGEIRWSNAAAERYMGIRNPGDIGVRLANLIRTPKFARFIDANEPEKSINISSPVDEQIHLNVRVVPYRDGERLITARDISDLIRADEMRRDFVSNASHELKTPLTVMMGYLELLESDPGITEDIKPIVKSASEQTIRMRSLVDDLLTLSRLDSNDSPAREPVMVAAMLESIVEDALQLSQQIDADSLHRIELSADSSLVINGSYQELISAFSNLVFNAVLHTPSGTPIKIFWEKEQDKAVFRVRDAGPGIPPQHLNRLTERFYRVQAGRERSNQSALRGRGTGLGLAITKHIVHSHNGTLDIQSEVNVGSEFSCLFPLKSKA